MNIQVQVCPNSNQLATVLSWPGEKQTSDDDNYTKGENTNANQLWIEKNMRFSYIYINTSCRKTLKSNFGVGNLHIMQSSGMNFI